MYVISTGEKPITWLFMAQGEGDLPGHTNVTGTWPGIPEADMDPSTKGSATSLHGHLCAKPVSKAIAALLHLRHRHAQSLSHLQVLTPALGHDAFSGSPLFALWLFSV